MDETTFGCQPHHKQLVSCLLCVDVVTRRSVIRIVNKMPYLISNIRYVADYDTRRVAQILPIILSDSLSKLNVMFERKPKTPENILLKMLTERLLKDKCIGYTTSKRIFKDKSSQRKRDTDRKIARVLTNVKFKVMDILQEELRNRNSF